MMSHTASTTISRYFTKSRGKALPLDLVKYLEIVVDAVCDIIPWPENRIKNIAMNKNTIDEIFEKKKHENDKRTVT